MTMTSSSLQRLFSPRSFRKLDIAFNSERFHPFFLERFANAQWNNKATPSFVSGPNILLETNLADKYNYWMVAERIECGLRYFMKPHGIAVFGHNLNNVSHSKLLVRTWLNASKKKNNALVLLENVDDVTNEDLHAYMIAVNNRFHFSQ